MTEEGLPRRVDGVRRLRGFSIREIARMAEISAPSNVREWMAGLPGRLREERVLRLLEIVGLDPQTGSLAPGLHRWRVRTGELPVIAETLRGVLPGKALFVRGRPEESLFRLEWLYVRRGEVRVLARFEEVPAGSLLSMMENLGSLFSSGDGLSSGEVRSLSPESAGRLASETLSPSDLDRLFLPPPPVSSGTPESWTYERLFERIWADGIEPDEVARRLGFTS